MPTRTADTARSDSARHEILKAASAIIADQGIGKLRMADVHKAAGVSSGLVYYHFTNRKGLIAATLEYINDCAASKRSHTVDSDVRKENGPYAQLLDTLLQEIQDDADVRNEAAAWNEIAAAAKFDADYSRQLIASTNRWQNRIADGIRASAHHHPDQAALSATELAIVATALIEGLSNRWLVKQLRADEARDLLRRAMQCLLAGKQQTPDA